MTRYLRNHPARCGFASSQWSRVRDCCVRYAEPANHHRNLETLLAATLEASLLDVEVWRRR